MWAGVEAKDLPTVWPQVEPLVEKSLRRTRGEMTARDVYILLCAGKWGLWIFGPDKERWGIVVTQIYDLPQKRICEIVTFGTRSGYSFAALQKEALPVISAWARERECDAMRFTTLRKGVKAAADLGWREIYVEMEYDLWQKVAAANSSSPASP